MRASCELDERRLNEHLPPPCQMTPQVPTLLNRKDILFDVSVYLFQKIIFKFKCACGGSCGLFDILRINTL